MAQARTRRRPFSLEEARFAVLDLETTGFSPEADRIVEIAVVVTDARGAIHREYTTLVRPGIPVRATRLHGISDADVVGAPRFPEIVGDVGALLRGAIVVGHNLGFDLRFLRTEFERARLELPPWPGLCTMQLARWLLTLDAYGLEDCCRALKVRPGPEHRALPDARATAGLLCRLLHRARRRGCEDVRELGCSPRRFRAVRFPPPSGRSLPR